jgi:hypothetical protein
LAEPWEPSNQNLGRSEKEAAFKLCSRLTGYLPKQPEKKGTEYGAQIFRWKDDKSWKYSFMPITPGRGAGLWEPTGRLPEFAEVVGYAHTHPNNSPHSPEDRETAIAKRGIWGGLDKMMQIVYVVNRNGAFWYDGRPEPGGKDQKKPWLTGDARYGALWGSLQDYLDELHSGKWG